MKRLALAAALMVGVASPVQSDEDRQLAFPKDYRDSFTQYYSGDRLYVEEQTIRLFANDIAKTGAQSDGKLPNGSLLVAELYAAQKDANGDIIESTLGRRLPGDLKAIVLMERGAGWDAQYADDLKVGDWEFEVFNAAGENLNKDTTACRQCHHPLGDSEYMFSLEHLLAAK
ncbi:MAG: cytochrome P460 family protein [Paracoccaceae bacterium]